MGPEASHDLVSGQKRGYWYTAIETEPHMETTAMSGVKRLAGSSSALLGLLAIGGVVAMAMYGKIESQSAVDFMKWIVIAYFTKVAVEDGATKLRGVPEAVASVVPVSAEPQTDSEEPETEEKG